MVSKYSLNRRVCKIERVGQIWHLQQQVIGELISHFGLMYTIEDVPVSLSPTMLYLSKQELD